MLSKLSLALLITFALSVSNEGCYYRTAGVTQEASYDSAVGIISVTGTTFEHHLVLRSGDKAIALLTAAADSAALTNLAGVEVLVHGDLEGSAMRVKTFTAMRVDGAPVIDGVLVANGDQLFVKTTAGLQLLGNPPAKLREMISARVWIGGPLDTGPNNYGIIVPATRL
jgi:hypothetical protein